MALVYPAHPLLLEGHDAAVRESRGGCLSPCRRMDQAESALRIPHLSHARRFSAARYARTVRPRPAHHGSHHACVGLRSALSQTVSRATEFSRAADTQALAGGSAA